MTHRRAVALMVLVTLLWSIAGVVTRHLDAARSFEVTFWRSGFNALSLAIALTLWRGAGMWRALARAPRIVWVSAVCWSVMYTAFMVALTLTSVANVLITMALGPMVTAIFSWLFLKRRLPARTWLAIAVAGAGIVWMFAGELAQGGSLLGSLVACAVPLAGAINLIVLQSVGERAGEAPDMLPAVMLGAAISALATLPLAMPLQASMHDLSLLAMLGTVQLALPCLLMVILSRALPAPEISLLALLEVIFGVAWAWLWAGEVPQDSVLSGGALVLATLIANEMAALRRAAVNPKI
ncbi:DMT family transporter [Dechloromonas sp.]|uniref:DMT family transporter n=1 Tax=Dechloromonas sp. TaxID=1917218 RepID=UPI00263F83D9|nr:DMT family transporter [Dechloromonas sp.]